MATRLAMQKPADAVPLIKKVIEQMDDDDGWVGLGGVGQRLPNLAPDFDPRTYGFTKLRDLVRETGAFEIEDFEAAVTDYEIARGFERC